MTTDVPRWVRLGVALLLGVPQLLVAVWALAAPKNWFESFPGFDPRLVAALPPYNGHLVRDVGAGFLATAVALLVAAVWANRVAILMALLAFGAFTLPHAAFHATHPADALTGIEDTLNTLSLASGLVFAAVFAWALRTRGDAPAGGTDQSVLPAPSA